MNGYKYIIVLLAALFIVSLCTDVAFADRGHKRGHAKKHHGNKHGYNRKHQKRRGHHRRGHRGHVFHAPGHRIASLPRRVHRISHGRSHYVYHSGMFYRPHRSGYVVIRAPIGVYIHALPPGHRRFHVGSHTYFYANFGYYTWVAATQQYVVVDKPHGADAALAAPYHGVAVSHRTSHQYCHEHAMKQSGYYPGLPDDHGTMYRTYQQVMATCRAGG